MPESRIQKARRSLPEGYQFPTTTPRFSADELTRIIQRTALQLASHDDAPAGVEADAVRLVPVFQVSVSR